MTEHIGYAFTSYWNKYFPSGVFEDIEGKRWFFLAISDCENEPGCKYLGKVKSVIDTPQREYNKEIGRISINEGILFMKRYRDMVENPEVCDLYCRGRM